ncbi:MAG: GerW family sporulation protein [Clostridia bacterium]|nr:GerW family sporulation protein [Clostridia bacterium]
MSNAASAKLEATINQIKNVVDVNTVIGQPIVVGEVTILPISKVTYGFASGGSDLPTKMNKELFAGGGGAGVSLQPLAFLIVSEAGVRILEISSKYNNGLDRALTMAPDLIEKVKETVSSFKGGSEEETAQPESEAEETAE